MHIIAAFRFEEVNVEVTNYVDRFVRDVKLFNCMVKMRKKTLQRIVLYFRLSLVSAEKYVFFGRGKRQPEIGLRLQAIQYLTNNILFVRNKNLYPGSLECRMRHSFNISKTKKDIPKRKMPVSLFLKSLSNMQQLFFMS